MIYDVSIMADDGPEMCLGMAREPSGQYRSQHAARVGYAATIDIRDATKVELDAVRALLEALAR